MSGFLGWVGGAVGGAGASTAFGRSLQMLCHGPRFDAEVIHHDASVALGVVGRKEPQVTTWSGAGGSMLAAVYGRPSAERPSWRAVNAETVGELYLDRGVEGLAGLDGSFVLMVLDRSQEKLIILTDRTGSIPVVHARGSEGIAFGPEAKALFGLAGLVPRLSGDSSVSFLNLGYPIGNRTIFEGVDQLPPGSFLEIDLRGDRVDIGRWWDLRFAPQTGMRRDDAVVALDQAMVAAHRLVLADTPKRTHLLLTGGFDSRAVLGYLEALSAPPAAALTWGVEEALPGSDPAIARAVAEGAGVPHRFLHYGADDFTREADRWAWVCELSSDNMGNYAVGPDFLERAGVEPEAPVLIGDQMLGPGGVPADRAEAIRNSTKIPVGGLLPDLAAMMKADEAVAAGATLCSQLTAIASSCATDHPKDIQDYLYFHLYVVRWLHASAYFREPMVSPRRPMLLAPVIEVGRQLPRGQRVDKAVLVALLRRKMPHLARYPIASAHSLIDWEWVSREPGELREFFLDLLEWDVVASMPVSELLDEGRFRAVVDSYFSEAPTPVNRRPSLVPRIMGWRRQLAGRRWLGMPVRAVEPVARRLLGVEPRRNAGVVLRRLALLSLLQRAIDAGDFDLSCSGESGVAWNSEAEA